MITLLDEFKLLMATVIIGLIMLELIHTGESFIRHHKPSFTLQISLLLAVILTAATLILSAVGYLHVYIGVAAFVLLVVLADMYVRVRCGKR